MVTLPGRLTTFLLVAALAGCAVCAACSTTTRYRVLSFFFDGVPPPGSGAGTKATVEGAGAVSGDIEATSPAPPVRFLPHTPYRQNRCDGCHDSGSGQLIRSVEDGLCLTCHSALVAEARYVHGPVAVSDCTVCHHHHSSPYANLLVRDPVATCLQCHDRDDLSVGEHHSAIGQRSCGDCHNPHGGNDRFFLKRSAP